MPARKKGRSVLVAALLFIALEVAAALLLSCTSSLQSIWIGRASRRALAFVWGWTDDVRLYMALREVNEELSRENFELSRQLDILRRLHPEEIDRSPEPSGGMFRYVPASIVKMSRGFQHNYIIINKGSADGVRPHSGIITGRGVVGQIDATGEHFSYGITLMNAGVAVSARLGEEGPIASLSWDGVHSDKAVLKELPLHYECSPGDTVYTSGVSTLFPGDIPVGTVRDVSVVDGAAGVAGVDLFLDFASLKYVTVAVNAHIEQISALEKEEEEMP